MQLPLLEQILVFGKSQITTQVIRACLWRNIPIVYLSRMGYCYGRIIPIEQGYRQLSRYQQQLLAVERLVVARQIVQTWKLEELAKQEALPDILSVIDAEIEQVSGDGAHDQRKCGRGDSPPQRQSNDSAT